MEVIFQDDEGMVNNLIGAEFGTAKAIVDKKGQNVLLVWLEDRLRDCWYRIHIDDFLCGIERYTADESAEDEDTDRDFVASEHTKWFEEKKVLSATVESKQDGDNAEISFVMEFDDKSSIKFSRNITEGSNKLLYVD